MREPDNKTAPGGVDPPGAEATSLIGAGLVTDIILAEPGVISGEAAPVPAPWPCRDPGADPEWWFPGRGDAVGARRAKRLCEPCPARLECLALALVGNDRHGVFGGMTVRERRALRQQGHPCGQCGARAPLTEPYCDGCRQAAEDGAERRLSLVGGAS